jgi:CubicO group peptidase (beta-lactamase class C family)
LIAAATLCAATLACGDTPSGLGTPASGAWPVATPADVGLAEQPLLDLKRDIALGEYGDVHSTLIVRNGRLVYEEYFGDATREDLHRVYSVTKSVAATLIGIAWDRGLIEDLDEPLVGFFPEYETLANPGQGKDAITLRHALQMRTGIEWDEWSTDYIDPTNPTVALFASDDWMKFMLDRPMAAPPGSEFVYNSGVSMLLSGVLEHATGSRVSEFADDALFGPLGVTETLWATGPNEIYNTGWGLRLRSRDMARIGQLYLQRGVWDGERVISEAWIDASTEPGTTFSRGDGYGYQWWLGGAPHESEAPYGVPSARGWGGQFIVVVPSLNAVVVTTQGNFAGLQGLDATRLVAILEEAAGVGGT